MTQEYTAAERIAAIAAIEKQITDPNAPLEALVLHGFWLDAKIALPPQRRNQPDSADVLCYVPRIDRYTIGAYNYVTGVWSTDLGRYEPQWISHWAYVPSINAMAPEKP